MPCTSPSVINPYMYFGVDETISWARGFPLNKIHDEETWNFTNICSADIEKERVAVIQSLANNEPDVDGIYRLTRKTPFEFTEEKLPFVLPSGSYSPFNGQATMWFPDAFVFMYLPTTVHGRVSDIWRSYIAEHFFGQLGLHVVFTKPYVDQFRNPHEYLSDFQSELDLYLKAPGLLDFLQSDSDQSYDAKTVIERAITLYIELYERSILEEDDIILFSLWAKNIVSLAVDV